MVERKTYLDTMKFIGVCCLFLAHVQGPFLLEELRGFDVPMMVFISGVLALPSMERGTSTKKYIVKRIKRLVIPTWIFLIIFYAAMYLIGQKPDIEDIIKSFLFQRDCGLAGGVWIIWVYLVCSLMAPILVKVISKKRIILAMLLVLLVYDGSICLIPTLIENRLFYYSVCTIIPYGATYALGMYLSRRNFRERWILSIGSLFLHLVLMIVLIIQTGNYVPISQYKYPARIYYLSYGFPLTIFIMEIMIRIENKIPKLKFIRFVSEHSLWIYLWQIMMLTVVNYILKINNHWFASWMFLLVGSVLITWIQNILVDWLNKKIKWSF